MPRSFPRTRVRVGARRTTTWIQFSPILSTLASNTTQVLVASLNAAALAIRPFTIVRTYLELALSSDQTAARESQFCSVGWAIVSDQAAAVGISAVPTPTLEAASGLWFLHSRIGADESQVANSAVGSQFRYVESKAMRKVEDAQDMVVVAEGGGVGDGMILMTSGRMLVKLH